MYNLAVYQKLLQINYTSIKKEEKASKMYFHYTEKYFFLVMITLQIYFLNNFDITNMSIESVVLSISSSVVPFSSCPQSFPASGSFQMSPFFPSGSQSIGASASASVLSVNIQD